MATLCSTLYHELEDDVPDSRDFSVGYFEQKKRSGWHHLMTLKLCMHALKENHAFHSAVMERVQTMDHPVMKKERNPKRAKRTDSQNLISGRINWRVPFSS